MQEYATSDTLMRTSHEPAPLVTSEQSRLIESLVADNYPRAFTFVSGTKWAALTLLVLFLLGNNSYGQSTVGVIIGTASTSDGAAIPGVTVIVANEGTHATQRLITGSHGEYAASALNPGSYTVTGSTPGFRTLQSKGIVVRSQQTVRVDFPLTKYDVPLQVVVTAGAPVIENEMPSISTTVTGLELIQTSSNLLGTKDSTGNSGLEEYIALLPTGHQGTSGSEWSMAGSTAAQDYYNVDGISSNSPLYGNAVGPAFPSFEIVEEVKYDGHKERNGPVSR
jgi:hypothetical protein